MITAIDTNIPSALWSAGLLSGRIAEALARAAGDGRLTVCGAVYAELLACPQATREFVDGFLRAGRLFTLDASRYRSDFPELQILE